MKLVCAAVLAAVLLSGCASLKLGEQEKELADTYYNLGNAYLRLGSNQEALRAYRRALEINPDLREASYNLALGYTRMGRHDDAVTVLSGLLESDAENTLLLKRKAWNLLKSDRASEALETYRLILQIDPGDAEVRTAMVYLLLDRHEFSQAREHALWLLEFQGVGRDLLVLLYTIERELAEFDSVSWLEQAYYRYPGDREIQELLITSYLDSRRVQEVSQVVSALDKPEELYRVIIEYAGEDIGLVREVVRALPDRQAGALEKLISEEPLSPDQR